MAVNEVSIVLMQILCALLYSIILHIVAEKESTAEETDEGRSVDSRI